ncbi:DinB family protein [Macrococcus animalis]|uniref:DinB family protein n=1 Tax=Macrococcus animalis TaxID=3395467 RepID=UPI0039BE3238
MFRIKQDFINQYRMEANTTIACLKELTDESLDQAVSELDRTLGEVAWHVVQSVGGFADKAGIKVDGATFGAPMPETVKDIVEAAETIYNNTLAAYDSSLTDEALIELVDFFGMNMPKGHLLYSMIAHQAHHRGQMTVLMRQADLKVPPIYGPSRDTE